MRPSPWRSSWSTPRARPWPAASTTAGSSPARPCPDPTAHRPGRGREVGVMLRSMPANPLTDPNWAAELADTVERVVGTVRDRATTPVVHITRGIVYGLLACVPRDRRPGPAADRASTRGMQAFFNIWLSNERSVYVSYLLIGGILCGAGTVGAEEASSPRRLNEERITMTSVRNVIIIGSGPAGLTAAIYTARANLAPARHRGRAVVHERPARRPAHAHDRGRELPRLPRRDHGPRADGQASGQQAERFGAEFLTEKVTRVDLSASARSGCGSATTGATRPTPSSSRPAPSR